MKLEAGKKYRTRDGGECELTYSLSNSDWLEDLETGLAYGIDTEHGHYVFHPSEPHARDIIAEL